MKTIWLIALDSIRSLLHQRLLIGLMLACLAVTIFFSLTLGKTRTNIQLRAEMSSSGTNSLTETERRRTQEQMDMAASGMTAGLYGAGSFGGSVVALFIFSTAVTSEIRKGTIRLTLSKPVSRTQFLLGKFLGGIVVMAAYAVLATVALLYFTRSSGVEYNITLRWAPWLMFCRQLMLGSFAMMLSLFIHPILAALLAFFAGNGLCSPGNPLYYILPSYQKFSVFLQVLQGDLINSKDVFILTLYALDFIILMLLLGLWRFRTKELV